MTPWGSDSGSWVCTHYNGDIVVPEKIYNVGREYIVTRLGDSAFGWCSGLTSITMPSTAITMGRYVFENCFDLESVTFGENMEDGGDFTNCNKLKEVKLNNKIKELPSFSGCLSLKHIDIPESVTTIGYRCLDNSGIEEFTLPRTVTTVNTERMFKGCNNLRIVDLNGYEGELKKEAFMNCTSLEIIKGIENVTKIYENCFDGSGITSNDFPSTVTYESLYHFKRCRQITKVKHENQNGGSGIYQYCTGLTTAYSNYIPSQMFQYCSQLTELVVADNINLICSDALRNTNKDLKVWFQGSDFLEASQFDGSNLELGSDAMLIVPKGSKEKFAEKAFFSECTIKEYDMSAAKVETSELRNMGNAKLSAYVAVPVDETMTRLPEWLVSEEVKLEWCVAGDEANATEAEWQRDGNNFTATLSGLEEGKSYRYRWIIGGVQGEWQSFASAAWSEGQTFTNGTILLNEDWYGTDEGSLNFWSSEDNVLYPRAFRHANPDRKLGTTSQYATTFGGKLLVVSKQAGEQGGILHIADEATLRHDASVNVPDRDGRAVVGVSADKVYLGTSDGIYPVSLTDYTVGAVIAGTEGSDGTYSGQTGDMVRVRDRVYATLQGLGVIVIDTDTDTKIGEISIPDIAGVFTTASGEVYAMSVNEEADIQYGFFRIDTDALTSEPVEVKKGTYKVENYNIPFSWGSWRSIPVAADSKDEKIYFVTGCPNTITSTSSPLIPYQHSIGVLDLTTGVINKFVDLGFETTTNADGTLSKRANNVYGTGIHVNPNNGEIMVVTCPGATLSKGVVSEGMDYRKWTYTVYGTDKSKLRSFTLPEYYWFPAMAVTPDVELPVVNAVEDVEFFAADSTASLRLENVVGATDPDSPDYNIMFSAAGDENGWLNATVEGNDVIITPGENYVHKRNVPVSVLAESNGRVGVYTFHVAFTRVPDSLEAPETEYAHIANGVVSLTLKSDQPDAAIYYTFDDETPAAEGILYTAPLVLTESGTVHAVALLEGVYSPVAEEDITVVNLGVPAIKLDPTDDGKVAVTITTADADARIYYTLDGSMPDSTSALYTGPVTLGESGTVKAIAEYEGVYSPVAEVSVTVTGIDELMNDSELMPAGAALYTVDGKRVRTDKPAPGIYILYHNGQGRRIFIRN